MNTLEAFLHEISKFFLTPVLVVLSLMFLLSLFYLGTLVFELMLRGVRGRGVRTLTRYARDNPSANQEALELHLLKLIEPLRITSRVAPMLGLVATMIPMGPALVAVSSGNTQGIASNLGGGLLGGDRGAAGGGDHLHRALHQAALASGGAERAADRPRRPAQRPARAFQWGGPWLSGAR